MLNPGDLPFSLEDRLAIVTGGGTGLGFAIASCFLKAGARVVIAGRRLDVLQEAAMRLGRNAFAEPFDVTSSSAAAGFAGKIESKYGAANILVNNAGTHIKKTIEDTSLAEFRGVMSTHVEGAFSLTQAVVPAMKRSGGGSVLFTASMSAIIGMPKIVAYSAAKAAYLGMVRSLASELGADNIRVNAIAPGWIQTSMLDAALSGDPERKEKILSRTPQHRFGRPEDIGWCAVFLCSDAAGFINGTVLPVDGGASIGF
ncbi:MAG: SDR family NAD(P)-dependent oxidoreductase [Acidobacteriota bacterium]